jgi:hypothetical protein
MSAKQVVTAQDFVSKLIITQEQGLDEVSALRDFDALLSQARQEAVKEYQRTKELIHTVIDQAFYLEIDKARREGRLEGLKEMDDTWSQMHFAKTSEWLDAHRDWDYDGGNLWKLRQEYQQPN